MLSESLKSITHISEEKEINSYNYFEALSYLDDIYLFLKRLSTVFNSEDFKLSFLPSFIGSQTSEKFGIPCTSKENEMKIYKLTSPLFSEDNIVSYSKAVSDELGSDADAVFVNGNVIEIVMK